MDEQTHRHVKHFYFCIGELKVPQLRSSHKIFCLVLAATLARKRESDRELETVFQVKQKIRLLIQTSTFELNLYL